MYLIRSFALIALGGLVASAHAQGRLEDYALILADPPMAVQIASSKSLRSAGAQDRMAQILTAQHSVREGLESLKIHITGSVQTVLNAVFVRATRDQAAGFRALPGVTRVVLLPPMRRHLDRAIDLVRAPAAWNSVGGQDNAGAGVKIGILDSGIDHTHPAFQDNSLPAAPGFPKGDASFTNRKVIVARSYVAQLPFAEIRPEDSRPDDISPRDRSGHGTAAAMIAAGARNSGPAATIIGVAPKAYLGNYKIFGSPGINEQTRSPVVIRALEDALNDGMDIVTLPLGGPALYGPLDRDRSCVDPATGSDVCDVRAQAVENAVRMGLTVVTSAGNDGDFGLKFPALGSVHTPGTAPSAITVGSSTNSHIFFAGLRVNGDNVPSNLQRVEALFGSGPKPNGALTAPLRDVSQLQNNGKACSALPAGSLNASIALVQRGDCPFSVKINNAQRAGAVAVVLSQLDNQNSLFNLSGVTETGIPAVLIRNAAGEALRNFVRSNPDRTVTLDLALQPVNATFDTVADSSSRGPSIGDAAIKPELVAVGTDLYTATQRLDPNGELYDASGYTSVQGTSFAAAMVTGAAALVKQRNGSFGPAQLKSAVVNTAIDEVNGDGGRARVTAVGAGKLNADAAVRVAVTVEPATLSFGVIDSGTLPVSRSLRITNTGGSSATLNIGVVARDQDSNARITVTPTSLPLGPGQSGTITVRLEGSRPAAGSYEGVLTIQGAGPALRVPYLYLVGDGIPFNVLPLDGADFVGIVNERNFCCITLKVMDRFGLPVRNTPVRFRVAAGGGSINFADETTDRLGIAAANVNLGQLGEQEFTGEAGGMLLEFFGDARPRPAINPGGVVNAASLQVGSGLAPGSYITIFGTGFSRATRGLATTSLPLSLAGISVSFDAPSRNLSLPGRLSFVNDTQINVQIPWEFQGVSSVSMKVRVGDIPSAVFTVPLSDYSPAAFEANGLAVAQDLNFNLVTRNNPARRGEAITIYANGLGPVSNQPASGEPSPAEPLARTRVTPLMTVGGRPAQVLFSGLTPPFVGLYQINIIVPPDAPTGVQTVVITANGIDSKTASLPVQ